MATLPSNLALADVASNAAIVSSDHRNNYSAIQTYVNALNTILSAGLTGQVLKSSGGTTVSWDYPPGYDYAYTEFTAPVSITATTEATANTIATASAVTFDGATSVRVTFESPDVTPDITVAGRRITYVIYDGAASIGLLGYVFGQTTNAANVAVHQSRKLTPSAGSHTYSIRAFVSAGTGTVSAGAGGAGNEVPGYIRVERA